MDREFNRLAGKQDVGNSDEENVYDEREEITPDGGETGGSPQESDGETVLPDFNPTIKGTNPQNLIEKILRNRIYENLYWKEHCFGLTAADLVDKAVELTEVGGTYGPFHHPTRFIMLLLRMLEIVPEREIVLEFIKVDEFRYLRLLGAFYMRLTGSSLDVYQYLEPLYNDYRKIRVWTPEGEKISHVDEFAWELVHGNFLCDISLPPIPKRYVLEKSGVLGPRISVLDDDDEDYDEEEIEDGEVEVNNSNIENGRDDDNEYENKNRGDEHGSVNRHETDTNRDDRVSDRHSHHSHHHHHHRHSRSRSYSRSKSRSRSKSPKHHHRSRSHKRHRSRSHSHKRHKSPSHSHDHSHKRHKSRSHKERKEEDPELAKMNELRVSIGLPPLDHL